MRTPCPLPSGGGSVRGVLLLMAALAASCGSPEAPRAAKGSEEAPVAVKTVGVALADLPQAYEATGTVRARATSMLSARIMSYVQEVRAQAGDLVKQGQVLVVLDARDLDAGKRQAEAVFHEARAGIPEADHAIAAANAQLKLAGTTLRRMDDLFRKKSISNQEYDEVAARMQVAQATYDMAVARRAQLDAKIRQTEAAVRGASVTRDFAEIRAPFSGVVTERRAEPGSVAAPGTPLLVLEQAGAYQLEASIEESRIGTIKAGTRVTVVLDALDQPIETRVSEIVPMLDPMARSFIAKIRLPAAANLRSGLFGRARFAAGSRRALTVPEEAVRRQGQMEMVWVADGGIARNRLITAGERSAGSAEILSGLSEGDRVIFPAPPEVRDGRRVEAK
ncbi:MAG: efflux RND transporter periplasmic adaptor subunit [Bryobacteraceae bacterium]